MTKIDDNIKEIKTLAAQNAAASKHWDKAVRYASAINKLKTERNRARAVAERYRKALDLIASDTLGERIAIVNFATDELEDVESA